MKVILWMFLGHPFVKTETSRKGYICDQDIDQSAIDVMCKSLGYNFAMKLPSVNYGNHTKNSNNCYSDCILKCK